MNNEKWCGEDFSIWDYIDNRGCLEEDYSVGIRRTAEIPPEEMKEVTELNALWDLPFEGKNTKGE